MDGVREGRNEGWEGVARSRCELEHCRGCVLSDPTPHIARRRICNIAIEFAKREDEATHKDRSYAEPIMAVIR